MINKNMKSGLFARKVNSSLQFHLNVILAIQRFQKPLKKRQYTNNSPTIRRNPYKIYKS